MKIALIGLGDIAQKAYLPLLSAWPGIQVVLCSRNQKQLSELAEQYRISHYCSDYRALADYQPDGVMIHAATEVHSHLARYFLNLGIPTFVDKPLCATFAECEALYELAARTNAPLFVGFNRRYLPILHQETGISGVSDNALSELRAIRWEKHRHNLPGDVRAMVFDDFIHAIDSVNLNGQLHQAALDHWVQFSGQHIARIDCRWQHQETLFEASMNRLYGKTCERITLSYPNRALELESLIQGHWSEQGVSHQVTLPDWTPMLAAKGFEAMLRHWFECVDSGQLPVHILDRNLSSHQICEALCQRISTAPDGATGHP
ncbi:Gfo/Idh/MocA family oxidoreductase [Lacimicrobium sp. SS2-24]|uniref:Gfo/Idh/MocA family protein n=1 Tax=Lacimicrobium sp. SS2-24 TaxID=2005569 RepID=UPI000B4BDF51|nr:Gfo/Idh/MocA family oxidoreductase [Lacimicrobium sp. SS2-24]